MLEYSPGDGDVLRGVSLGSGFGVKMGCKTCKSENLRKLEGELTASLPELKAVKVAPIYVCQNVLVCLDCGFAELLIPAGQLKLLKESGSGL